ncbi:tellurite resistance protein permease [Microlunatus elymi]|uniref:Tellurite resistance protein permease n=1 Tax=Microlunatus elymi TaxID=2596828 RepID=A0A516Q1N3_9ACTN|nr:tellurite resistance/C4-dicarboxylate transporter family protein [Microlunatus elymi]QDP97292.1 tellurite resistance protein permease [Microlunatus elymi]
MNGCWTVIRAQVSELHPAYAAVVMATGIVSTGLALVGQQVLSIILLILAVVSFLVLLVGYVWRLIMNPGQVIADSRDPASGFGFFTLVAGANVIGDRLAMSGMLLATEVLAAVSGLLWLFLTYAVLGAMIAGRRRGPILPNANGSWFLLVVSTQSLATSAAAVATAAPDRAAVLAPVAVILWGVGVIWYLLLAGLLIVPLLERPTAPRVLGPTYWIYMGATAITVLAAARILQLPRTVSVVAASREAMSGISLFLWAFGTWWIPLLIIVTLRQHVLAKDRVPVHYEPTIWSVAFPLGMYAVASDAYGRLFGLPFMIDIGAVEVWIGLGAWLGISAAMGRSVLSAWRQTVRPQNQQDPSEKGLGT